MSQPCANQRTTPIQLGIGGDYCTPDWVKRHFSPGTLRPAARARDGGLAMGTGVARADESARRGALERRDPRGRIGRLNRFTRPQDLMSIPWAWCRANTPRLQTASRAASPRWATATPAARWSRGPPLRSGHSTTSCSGGASKQKAIHAPIT